MTRLAVVPGETIELPGVLVQFGRKAKHYPPLTAREEFGLTRQVERGDLKAKERLTNHNLHLVAAAATRRFTRAALDEVVLDVEDLIEEGKEGLVHAVDKCGRHSGRRFSTFARDRIYQAMRRHTGSRDQTLLPLKVEATMVPDPSTPDPAQQLINEHTCQQLRQRLIKHLGIAGDVLILKYGIGGSQQRTATQIADLLDLSVTDATRLNREGLSTLAEECPAGIAELLGDVFQHRAERYHESLAQTA